MEFSTVRTKTGMSIRKPYSPEVSRLIREKQLLENRIDQAEALSMIDPLTKIHTRKRLEVLVNSSVFSPDASYTVMFVDIDDFKKVNDTYGHDAGDRVLSRCASLIRKDVRPEDEVIRYGGEEILIIFMGLESPAKKAKEICELILHSHENDRRSGDEQSIPVTVSVGVAEHKKGTEENFETVVKHADEMMYKVKQSGKNNFAIYYDN